MPSRPEPAPLTFSRALSLTLLCVVVPMALATLYESLPVAGPAWWRAALVHTALSLVVVALWHRRGELRATLAVGGWRAYLPGLVVALGAAILAAASAALLPDPASQSGAPANLAWILWVPVVEEVVFRGGVFAALRRFCATVWAAWFSAIIFALAHAGPTLTRLLSGDVGVPLGPFFLGLLTAALYARTGRLLPAVLLHAACNATPLIFAALDARWLDWLGFLYQ